MIKNRKLKIVLLLSMPILMSLNFFFPLAQYGYFTLLFFLYGIMNRLHHRYTIIWIFFWWYALLFWRLDFSILYFALLLGLIGNLVGVVILKIKEITLPKTLDISKYRWVNYLFPLLIFILLEGLYASCNPGGYYHIGLSSLVLNMIFIYSIWFILLAITNRPSRANALYLFLFLVFFIINQLKVFFTSEVISASDFSFLNQTGEVFTIIEGNLLSGLWYYRQLFLVLLIQVIFLSILFYTFGRQKISIRVRLCCLTPVLVLWLLLSPSETLCAFIEEEVYQDQYITKLSSLNDHYGSYRMLGGLYEEYLASIDYSTDILSEEDLKKLYASVQTEKTTPYFKKPNIIVMFTESFWDITKQSSILFDKDPLEEYHLVANDAIRINTLSPSFGGRSANTEFEFLTGASLSYLPSGSVAYDRYYQTNEAKDNPSILKELSQNGYTTEVLNAATSQLYHCGKIYPQLGFSKMRHLYDELHYSVKDSYLVDEMIKRFENKDEEEKLFYMTISMESHMPYNISKYDSIDFEIVSDEKQNVKNLVSAYTQSIRNASLQLVRAYEYIQTLEEDTILIFFGDHLPFLRVFDADVYRLMKEFNTTDALYNTYLKYNTETLIFSNYDILYDDIEDMSTSMIFTTILNHMDVDISDYYRFLYSTRTQLPAVNGVVAKDLDGQLYTVDSLPRQMQTVYDSRKKVQKYLFK